MEPVVIRKQMANVDRSFEHLYPEFASRVSIILASMQRWCAVHSPGVIPELGEGYRSVSRQKELYARGRTKEGSIVTYKDGVVHRSNHQSSLAFDLWLKIKGKKNYDWNGTPELWDYFGHLCRAQGLKWGGDWSSFKDKPHCEWNTADYKTYIDARAWQKVQGLA